MILIVIIFTALMATPGIIRSDGLAEHLFGDVRLGNQLYIPEGKD